MLRGSIALFTARTIFRLGTDMTRRRTEIAIAPSDQIDRELIDRVAAEIGTDLLAYINRMYPAVYEKMNSGCKVSIRNHIRNDIASAVKCKTAAEYREWIAARRKHRRRLKEIPGEVEAWCEAQKVAEMKDVTPQ